MLASVGFASGVCFLCLLLFFLFNDESMTLLHKVWLEYEQQKVDRQSLKL